MRIIEATLIAGLVVSVAAFGGTEPVSFAVVEVLFFAVAAWLIAGAGRLPVRMDARWFAVPAALTAIALLQLLPVGSAAAGSMGRATGGDFSLRTLSVAPHNSRSELLILLACFVAFFFACAIGKERARLRRVVLALVAIGAAEAFYGLIQYLLNWQRIFWYAKKYDLEEATGTYINRNHFAGLLEMILPFAICLALYEGERIAGSRSDRRGSSKRMAARLSGAKAALWLAVSMVLAAAIVFSRSRMGMVAAAGSLVVIFGLKVLERRTIAMALGASFVVLSICFAAWIGVWPALNRFTTIGDEFSGAESRLSMWPGTLKLIGEHPLLGTGLGTFPVVYTQVQTTFVTKFVNHAHNDYLEFASDLGIPAALLLFGSILFVLARAVRNSRGGESRYRHAMCLACAGSIAAILLHSLTDFNLHIPANGVLFAVILGLAMGASHPMSIAEPAS
ncbi:MAG TPA: O-antigen ligase family protein [Candidatus Limnocylindrales bacterium]|nr:O-antigen ligase family protein [Candidatus Limnocylindrales bacterium]